MLETPITEAKNTFTSLVHQVEEGEVVHLTRHGRPVAVILSEEGYQALRRHVAAQGDLLDFVQGWRRTLPSDWQGLDTADLRAMRAREPGREFTWEA